MAEPAGAVDVVDVAGVDPDLQAVAVLGPRRRGTRAAGCLPCTWTANARPASLHAARTSAQAAGSSNSAKLDQPIASRPAPRPRSVHSGSRYRHGDREAEEESGWKQRIRSWESWTVDRAIGVRLICVQFVTASLLDCPLTSPARPPGVPSETPQVAAGQVGRRAELQPDHVAARAAGRPARDRSPGR